MANILIVDDDPSVRELLKDFLEAEGHAVETAGGGREGLDKLREGRFQLATLDVGMPLMGGMEVLKLIRSDPKLAKLPVLMVTGRSMPGELEAALADGATGYIVKPFDFEALVKTVAKALTPGG